MYPINSNPAITQELFDKVVKLVSKACRKALKPGNSKMILIEADLQAWIYHILLCGLREETGWRNKDDNGNETDTKQIGVHCNLRYLSKTKLNQNRKSSLRNAPDIIIIDKKEYDVDSSKELFKRKGINLWGSSIMLELKVYRSFRNDNSQFKDWKDDIDKLVEIKKDHYSSPDPLNFFPAFVLLAKNAPRVKLDEIKKYAEDRDVIPLIFHN